MAMVTFRRSSSQLGQDAHETSYDLKLLGVTSDPSHLDLPLDSEIDCGKDYSSSFIFAVGRGRTRDFMRSQLLGVASDHCHLDFFL